MITKNDLAKLSSKLTYNELLLVIKEYDKYFQNPLLMHENELSSINEDNGVSTIQISDRKIAILAQVCGDANYKAWESYFNKNNDFEMYCNIYNGLYSFILENAANADAKVFVEWLS